MFAAKDLAPGGVRAAMEARMKNPAEASASGGAQKLSADSRSSSASSARPQDIEVRA
jgi:hypothetical protein